MSKQLNMWEPIDEQVKRNIGNTKLVEYGILNEVSDFRVHVGCLVQRIFVFPTQDGIKALDRHKGQLTLRDVWQNGIKTAEGYPMPSRYIENLQEIPIPPDIYSKNVIYNEEDTSRKGLKATAITVAMLKRGLISLPINATVIDDKDLQVEGADIEVHSQLKIQVKCDYRAGDKKYHHNATGNLFFQTKECNPEKRY